MNLADVNTWLDYHYWARDIILDAVAPLSAEQFTRPVESSFRFVPHFGCNLRYRIAGRGKHLRPQLKPPTRQIGHRSLVEVMTKAFGQY